MNWSYWKSRFHLDPAVLGKQIVVQGRPATIVGVAPRGFFGVVVGSRTDVWAPGTEGSILFGRLRSGVSLEQARAEMSVLYRFTLEELSRTIKGVAPSKVEVEPAAAGLSRVRDRFAQPLVLLMVVVGVLLLIACVNTANMLFARAAARRAGNGGARWAGGHPDSPRAAGDDRVRAAFSSRRPVRHFVGACRNRCFSADHRQRSRARALHPSRSARPSVAGFHCRCRAADRLVIRIGSRSSCLSGCTRICIAADRQGWRDQASKTLWKGLVVAAQVAWSVLLLSAAGLFLGYLSHLRNLDLGFQRDHVLLVTLDSETRSGFKREQLGRLYEGLVGRLESIPGISSVSISAVSPIQGAGAGRFVTAEGRPAAPRDSLSCILNWVAPRVFGGPRDTVPSRA